MELKKQIEEDYFDEEPALATLLQDGEVFCNSRRYIDPFSGKPQEETVVLFVNCNDVFAWAAADSEPFTTADIEPLYKLHVADKKWGVIKWCCFRRNVQPQRPVKRDMQKEGAWDDRLEALPENPYDRALRERFEAEQQVKE